MAVRLRRPEQTERNRALLLAAARRVFLARGYHGATLEQIADDAGFSKGVVYSQFRSKADLFLALLDERIAERARDNVRVVTALAQDVGGWRGVVAMIEHAARIARAEPQWGLLVIEFRVHAARDSALNERYAAAHERTIEGVADVVRRLYEVVTEEPPGPVRQVAEFVLAVGAGAELEQAVNGDGLPGALLERLLESTATRGRVP
jgi:AcrR family transcriptional regulator